jgi:hypothetical protein
VEDFQAGQGAPLAVGLDQILIPKFVMANGKLVKILLKTRVANRIIARVVQVDLADVPLQYFNLSTYLQRPVIVEGGLLLECGSLELIRDEQRGHLEHIGARWVVLPDIAQQFESSRNVLFMVLRSVSSSCWRIAVGWSLPRGSGPSSATPSSTHHCVVALAPSPPSVAAPLTIYRNLTSLLQHPSDIQGLI